MPHPLGEAKILGKKKEKKVWCFFFVKKWDKGDVSGCIDEQG